VTFEAIDRAARLVLTEDGARHLGGLESESSERPFVAD